MDHVVGPPPQPQDVANDNSATEGQQEAAINETLDGLTGR